MTEEYRVRPACADNAEEFVRLMASAEYAGQEIGGSWHATSSNASGLARGVFVVRVGQCAEPSRVPDPRSRPASTNGGSALEDRRADGTLCLDARRTRPVRTGPSSRLSTVDVEYLALHEVGLGRPVDVHPRAAPADTAAACFFSARITLST